MSRAWDTSNPRLPGPTRHAWMLAFRRLCDQHGLPAAGVAATAGLGHLIESGRSGDIELRLDQQAALTAALGVPLSELIALAEQIERTEGRR